MAALPSLKSHIVGFIIGSPLAPCQKRSVNCFCVAGSLVNDSVGTVHDFAHGRFANFRHNAANFGKGRDGKRAVDQFIAKGACAFRIVLGDESDDFFQIAHGLRRQNYFETHASTSLWPSCAGVPSPRAACSRAVWMPASSSISRAISASDISSGSLLTNSRTVSRLLMC